MICPNCKTPVADSTNFCPNCGTPRALFLKDGDHASLQNPAPASVRPSLPSLAPFASAVGQAAGLRAGERPVQIWRAGYVLPDRPGTDDDQPTSQLPGLLIATDQRLLFLQERGMLNKSYTLKDSMDLGQIVKYALSSFLRMKGLDVEVREGNGLRKQRFSNLYEIDPSSLKPLRPSTPEEARGLLDALFQSKR